MRGGTGDGTRGGAYGESEDRGGKQRSRGSLEEHSEPEKWEVEVPGLHYVLHVDSQFLHLDALNLPVPVWTRQ